MKTSSLSPTHEHLSICLGGAARVYASDAHLETRFFLRFVLLLRGFHRCFLRGGRCRCRYGRLRFRPCCTRRRSSGLRYSGMRRCIHSGRRARRSLFLLRQTRQCLARCQPRELGQKLTARITGAARALRRRKEIAVCTAFPCVLCVRCPPMRRTLRSWVRMRSPRDGSSISSAPCLF